MIDLELLLAGLLGLTFLGVYLGVVAIVAVQARRRGYNFWLWWLFSALGNPIFFLVLLAVMPHRNRLAMRERFAEELDAKLAETLPPGRVPTSTGPGDSERTIGDLPTADPIDRSLGDLPTRDEPPKDPPD